MIEIEISRHICGNLTQSLRPHSCILGRIISLSDFFKSLISAFEFRTEKIYILFYPKRYLGWYKWMLYIKYLLEVIRLTLLACKLSSIQEYINLQEFEAWTECQNVFIDYFDPCTWDMPAKKYPKTYDNKLRVFIKQNITVKYFTVVYILVF